MAVAVGRWAAFGPLTAMSRIAADGTRSQTGANIIASQHYSLSFAPPGGWRAAGGNALQVGDIATDTCASSGCCSSSCFKLCNASSWPQRAFRLYNGPPAIHPPPAARCPGPATFARSPGPAFGPHKSRAPDKVLHCQIKTKQPTGKAIPTTSPSTAGAQKLPFHLVRAVSTRAGHRNGRHCYRYQGN